jgi:hypothetical protein
MALASATPPLDNAMTQASEGETGITPETWRVLQSIIAEAQKAKSANATGGVSAPKAEPVDTPLPSAVPDVPMAAPPPVPVLNHPALVNSAQAAANTQLSDRDREALQAQLNLLAAQLEDYDDMSDDDEGEDEDEDGEGEDVPREEEEEEEESRPPTAFVPPFHRTADVQMGVPPMPVREEEEEEEVDEDDMEVVDIGQAIVA